MVVRGFDSLGRVQAFSLKRRRKPQGGIVNTKIIAHHTIGNNVVRVTKTGRKLTATWCYLHNAGGVEFVMHEAGAPSVEFGTYKGALFGLAAELSSRNKVNDSRAVLELLSSL